MNLPITSDRAPRGYLFKGVANHDLICRRATLAGVEALPDSDPNKNADVKLARAAYIYGCLALGNLWAHTCDSETRVLN